MPRIRDLGIYNSDLPTGKYNAITDVEGISVGHSTIIEGNGPRINAGPYRTGVTVIMPHQENLYEDKVAAAAYRINGFGKYAGFEQIRETGNIETPIALTSTLNMPAVANSLISESIKHNPHIGLGFKATNYQGYPSVNPVVAECSDGFLNDAQARRVGEHEVQEAISSATFSEVAEGSVGGGTGMSCFNWKGGIGTASRLVKCKDKEFTVGVLVQSNFGKASEFMVSGVRVGKKILPPNYIPTDDFGSIIIVIATDAPLDGRQLERLSKRASYGLARVGGTCESGSGEVVLAFSTTYRVPDRPDSIITIRQTLTNEQPVLTILSKAVIESVEEAVYNSIFMSPTMIGRDGNTRYGLPIDEVAELVKKYRMST